MKKALAMALGAVLVAGSAAPASATNIDINGFYKAYFHTFGNLGFTGNDNVNDTYFAGRFRLNVNFQATEAVSVHWRLHAPDGQRWGNNTTNGDGMRTRYVYGQVVQDWGTVRVGKLAGNHIDEFGLSTLGYAPALDNEFTYVAPFEGSSEYNGIQYSNTWDNGFTLHASYAKVDTGWDAGRQAAPGNYTNHSGEHDADRFQVEGAYQWDGGGAALNIMYERDATGDGNTYNDDGFVAFGPEGKVDKTSIWYLNPAIMHSWGAFSVHAEGKFAFGEETYYDDPATDTIHPKDTDVSGQGVYLDMDYNYGPGHVTLAGWWVSGNDLGDTDNNAAVDIVDGNFYPLVTAFGFMGPVAEPSNDDSYGNEPPKGAVGTANSIAALFNTTVIETDPANNALKVANEDMADVFDSTAPGMFGNLVDTNNNPLNLAGNVNFSRTSGGNGNGNNHWALMLSGQHGITDEITFNYALAYLSLTNPNYSVLKGMRVKGNTADQIKYHTQDKELGWEIDLGVNVQLLENLAFTSTFGYMFTGDAYQTLKGYTVYNNSAGETIVDSKWEDADNAYSWVNSLAFSF